MNILKFGGTSVGNPEAIRRTLDIIKNQYQSGTSPVVVCSAMGTVTNGLLAMGQAALDRKDFIEELRRIESLHQTAIYEILKIENQNRALIGTKVLINEIEELLYGIKALGELSPAIKDKLSAYGELLSNQMIALMVDQEVGKAVFADARDMVKTDSHFGSATLDEDITYTSIQAWHATLHGAIGVVTGFIGSDPTGRTTTLGRGGSDYTASVIGAALGAEEIQIWTDVDGFMTADPRHVKSAYSLKSLSYEEAMELSYFGAKVIYPPTMIPAVAREIPIAIKNTFNSSHAGTRIESQGQSDKGLIKGIASVGDVHLVNVQGSGLIGMKGFSARMFIALAEAGVNVMLITQASSEHSISLAVSPEDGPKSIAALNEAFSLELKSGKMQSAELVTDLSVLAVVGENMRHARGLSGKLFSTFGKAGINVVAIAQGSSELNISVVIDKQDLVRALNAVHDSLFLSPLKTVNVFCAGTGTIGAELLDQLHAASAFLASDHHLQIKVLGITNSRKMLLSTDGGLDLSSWREDLDKNGQKADLTQFLHEMYQQNLPNTALVDNTSNRSFIPHYADVFANDLSVITCNKIGNSESYDQYQLFKEAARRSAVNFHYETTVGAALPIIRTLNDLRISGDTIRKIEAILSGTISFIFNNFNGERSFADVVREAQAKGYTEPDPRDDLNGLDFARKMLILSREMGLKLEMTDVQIDPILPEPCLQADSIEQFYDELSKADDHFEALKHRAKSEQKVMRYIGVLENDKIRISMKMVDADHAFYGLTGSDNIIAFTTDRYLHDPLVVKGPGAGPQVTAAGVFADIVRVAQS